MSGTDDREAQSEEREGATEDVEAHLADRPPSERPPAERATEGDDDVEAHSMLDRPPSEQPPAE